MEFRVRKADGWTTIAFPVGVEKVEVVTGKTDGHLTLTLIGHRDDAPNVIEPGILDVDGADEERLSGDIPRTDDGTSWLIDRLRS
ncbi:hypothetical protein [Haloarcula pellucida]|uniref:Uncharacterized protein n=1 Tax=Haloarcula pellucida TaxID=1427151 RepID=A0A830GRD5_9EURY|nr:hypothetical protein [Halomicroarcula pellucida]MBX0350548.1 hypothetical protein [Halomicroarcula pellucida]GGO03851.1 hypothetical protein GCM10009030_39950 [Halomicroarcula pellucida]